jgi:spore maturation protein CgeB
LIDADAMASILLAQIDALRPELVLNHDLTLLTGPLLGEVRSRTSLLVGQQAAVPLPVELNTVAYDLIVSSFPPMVDELRRRGARAELSRLAFDPAVLARLSPDTEVRLGLTFVGSLAPIHSSRREFLETLAQLVPDLQIWSANVPPRGSVLRERHVGEAWGREMFECLRASRATVNHHGDVAPFANNLRLFEATGVGTVLLTDAKPDLAEMFAPGSELIAYTSAADCAAAYHALDDSTRASIAVAGQARTLRDHTYLERVRELLAILESYGTRT